jgi:hypothetical protein
MSRGGSCSRAGSSTTPKTFLELLQGLGDQPAIALEATYGWEWLADLLEDAGYELHLSHRLRTKAIAAARVKRSLSSPVRRFVFEISERWRPPSCRTAC